MKKMILDVHCAVSDFRSDIKEFENEELARAFCFDNPGYEYVCYKEIHYVERNS